MDLISTIFQNHFNLKNMDMQSKPEVKENPLFTIARKKHNDKFISFDYDFLHLTTENENTFVLGFCDGIAHASIQMGKQLKEAQDKLEELQRQQSDKEQSPTLHRQDEK